MGAKSGHYINNVNRGWQSSDESFEKNHKGPAVDHTKYHDVLKELKTQQVCYKRIQHFIKFICTIRPVAVSH
jgi:hypothetical protein